MNEVCSNEIQNVMGEMKSKEKFTCKLNFEIEQFSHFST